MSLKVINSAILNSLSEPLGKKIDELSVLYNPPIFSCRSIKYLTLQWREYLCAVSMSHITIFQSVNRKALKTYI